MTPADVVLAIGQAGRAAARGKEADSEFARGQLLSAYSIARHLSVEIEAYEPELNGFVSDVSGWAGELGGDGAIGAAAEQLRLAEDTTAIADATCVLLECLRADGSPAAAQLRLRVRKRLRALADREVELLAEVIEGGARS